MDVTIYLISAQTGQTKHDVTNHTSGVNQTTELLKLTHRAFGVRSNTCTVAGETRGPWPPPKKICRMISMLVGNFLSILNFYCLWKLKKVDQPVLIVDYII